LSETEFSADSGEAEASPVPVAFAVFAASLRPPLKRDDKGKVVGIEGPGHADEIWLKFIKRQHGMERHSLAGWMALIDRYRDQPAHPADHRYVR